MKRGLLIFLAVCAFTAAMVPRVRREENKKDEEEKTTCAPQTPCAWSLYNPVSKITTTIFDNTYCVCGHDTVCQVSEDDEAASAYVHKCKSPNEGTTTES